jgi:hypothetical protein
MNIKKNNIKVYKNITINELKIIIQPKLFNIQYLNKIIEQKKSQISHKNIFEKYFSCLLKKKDILYNLTYNDTEYKFNLQQLEKLYVIFSKNYDKNTGYFILPELCITPTDI